MNFAATLLVAGLSVGSIYAMIAITLNLTYWTTRTVNFGQGSILMLSAMGTIFLARVGLPLGFAVLVAVGVAAVVMILIERIAIRPAMSESGSMGWAVSTLGVGILLQGLVARYFGSQAVAFPEVLMSSDLYLTVGGIRIGAQYLLVFTFSIVTIAVMEAFLRQTVWGRAVRAVAQDRELAGVMGMPVSGIILISFAVSGMLAGTAGILTAQIIGTVDPAFGFNLLMSGFVAGILGGFGSNIGALVGGLLIGVIEQFASGYVSTALGHGISMVILLLMLAFRPQGLFGTIEVEKA